MSEPIEVSATLTIFGAAPTRATATLVPLSPGRRLVRALGVLAGCWGAAAVTVLIPVAHLLLVPALAVAGPVWAVLRFRQHQRLVRVQGVCPRCGRVQAFTPAGTRARRPAVQCPGCLKPAPGHGRRSGLRPRIAASAPGPRDVVAPARGRSPPAFEPPGSDPASNGRDGLLTAPAGGLVSVPAGSPGTTAGRAALLAGRVFTRRATSLAPRVVVLGGGFAGVTTALELARRCAGVLPVDITLISDRNFFLFTPMLAEAATGAVETRHVLHPIRPLCTAAGVEFGEMRVEEIDLARRRVTVRHRRSRGRQAVRYDRLVLALGAAPNVGMAPGAAEHTLTFKEAGDAVQIRNRVIDLFEAAALTDDPWTRRRLLTFVVVGAGHAGTELMAALEELTRGILLRHYPSVPPDAIRLVLVGSAILPQTASNLAAYAREQLLGRGIELETSRAAAVSAEGLRLQDGRLVESHCVIWTAGNRVNPVVTALPLPKARDGRLLVSEFFEVEGAPGVYALGDNAAQTDPHTREPYVATAQVALRQGRALAAQIEAELTGRERRPFRFRLVGEMAPLGRRTAVADLRGWKLTGFAAWLLWKTVYMLKLPTVATRVRVVLDWTVELFFERDVSELTVDGQPGA